MFGISRRMFGVMACAALGCLVTSTLVRGEDAPAAGTGTITGPVTSAGAPAVGATVRLMAPKPDAATPAAAPKAAGDAPAGDKPAKKGHGKAIAETTTGADGSYTFSNVAAGNYVVMATLKGTGSAHGEATVAAGGSVKVDLTLEQHKKKAAN